MGQTIVQNRTHVPVGADNVVVLADILVPDRNSFGALRLALAVSVLVSHSYWLTAGTTAAEPLVSVTGRSLGEHAVQVFFFLSGLMVTQSLVDRRGITDFAVARAVRILPALIVCVLATALLLGPWLSTYPASIYLGDPTLVAYIAKTSALMTGSAPLPGLFAFSPVPNIVNSSLWTLKYEVACYAGLALVGVAGLLNACWRGLAISALVLAIVAFNVDEAGLAGSMAPTENLRHSALFFSFGVIACLLGRHIAIMPGLLLPLGSMFFVALDTRWADVSTALFLGYGALIAGSLDLGWLRRACNGTDLSYGVYLYACPIQQAMLQLYPGTPALPLTLAAIAVVVPIAGLSWTFIEKPALALRRRTPVHNPVQTNASSSVPIARALRAANGNAPVTAELPRQHVVGPISARLAALREADRVATLPCLPRRDWRYSRRRIPQTRRGRLMADVTRYTPSRRARIRARLRPVYQQDAVVVRFRPHLV